MKRNSKIITFLIISYFLSSLLLLSGCWNKTELNETVIVSGTGIDMDEDGKIKIAVQIIQPTRVKKKESSAFVVFTSKGESVFEAINNFTSVFGRKLVFNHLKIIIIGPNIADTDLQSVLDYFLRDGESRLRASVFYADQPVEEILKAQSPFEPITAIRIQKEIEINDELLGYAPLVRLYEFERKMLVSDGATFAPIIRKVLNEGYPLISIHSIAVFNHGKKVGSLNKKETRGVLWLTNRVKGGSIIVSLPLASGAADKKEKVTLKILTAKSDLKPTVKGGRVTIQAKIETTMNIADVEGYLAINESEIKEIEKKAEQVIKEEINSSLIKNKKWQADIYCLNQLVHQQYPDFWQENRDNWGDLFAEMDLKIEVEAKIRNSGFLKHSLE